MKKIRSCVIGMGFIGAVHVEALRRLGNVEVIAVADAMDAERKAEELYIQRGYSDYREMIDREKPEVIHICTPNNSHYEIAMYAMERGIHVVCEKPLSISGSQAREMVEMAKRKGIVNAVNFSFRFNPQVMQMKAMVRDGDIGSVYSVHGAYLQDWLFYDTDYSWRLETELSGNSRAFTDTGSHWIDMAEFIMGQRVIEVMADFETFHKVRKKPLKPVETYANMELNPNDYQEIPIHTEDYASVLFHFDGGARGSCVLNQMFAGRKNQSTIAVSGSKQSLYWDSDTANELWSGRRDDFNYSIVKAPSILAQETKNIISYPGGHAEGFADTFKHNFREIYSAIEHGIRVGMGYADFEDGMHVNLLCEAILQSAAEKKWIKVEV